MSAAEARSRGTQTTVAVSLCAYAWATVGGFCLYGKEGLLASPVGTRED